MEKMELTIILGILAAVIVIAMVFIALYPDGPPAAHGEGHADEGHETDGYGETDTHATEDSHAEETDAVDHGEPVDDHTPAEAH